MYQHIKYTEQFQNQPKNKHLILIFLLLDSTWLTWLDSNQLNLTTEFTTFYLFSDSFCQWRLTMLLMMISPPWTG